MYGISNDRKLSHLRFLQRSKVKVKPWINFEVQKYLKTVQGDRGKTSIEVSVDKNIFDLR